MIYVRTIFDTPTYHAVTCTPIDDAYINMRAVKPYIVFADTTVCNLDFGSSNVSYIPMDIVQICIDIGDKLYVWKEWEL